MLESQIARREHCAQAEIVAGDAQGAFFDIAEKIRCGAIALSFVTDSEYFDTEVLAADVAAISVELEHLAEALAVEKDKQESAEIVAEILRQIAQLRAIVRDDRTDAMAGNALKFIADAIEREARALAALPL
jgi:hypothetical protein